jgi:glutamate--cysteine ligase catalytic subunit
MDEQLSRHFAHLFIQDPLVVYRGKIKIDDTTHSDHFENIQSTNWQSVRFKVGKNFLFVFLKKNLFFFHLQPPPPHSNIGWRVEFRSMELQFHDFENAAYVIFVNLLTRVLMQFPLNL